MNRASHATIILFCFYPLRECDGDLFCTFPCLPHIYHDCSLLPSTCALDFQFLYRLRRQVTGWIRPDSSRNQPVLCRVATAILRYEFQRCCRFRPLECLHERKLDVHR